MGDAIGIECRASGANLFAGVCVNLLRHPAWGRAQESFGEDPHLVGEMGAALVRGTQRHVMACVKHLACNSIEDTRFKVDVVVDEDDLRDIWLPAFRRCVDEGVAAVMTAYNRVNGERCGHHRPLITDVLKGEWGFDGFVMSDFVLGVRSARGSGGGAGPGDAVPLAVQSARPAAAPGQGHRRAGRRRRAAHPAPAGALRRPGGAADRAPADAGRYAPARIAGEAHRALARTVAERSIVLLRNQAVRVVGPRDGQEPSTTAGRSGTGTAGRSGAGTGGTTGTGTSGSRARPQRRRRPPDRAPAGPRRSRRCCRSTPTGCSPSP